MASNLQPRPTPPRKGVFSLLARQFGEIVKALKAPVRSPTDSNTLYRESKIEEQPLPSDPNVTLRRTVIDEVIVTGKNPNDETRNPNQ